MRFRLNFFKILRLIVIAAFAVYAFQMAGKFMKEKNKKTDEVAKTFDIRKNDFHNSENKGKKTEEEQKAAENTQTNNIQAINTDTAQNNQAQNTENKVEEQKTDAEKEAAAKAEADKKAAEQKNKELEAQKIQKELSEQKKKEVEAAKKTQEKAEAEKKAKEAVAQKTAGRKYLQVATLQTEAAAKKVAAQLGGNFTVQAIKGSSGRTMYRVVSASTDNPQTLSAMESQVKSKLGGSYKYIVRTAGK